MASTGSNSSKARVFEELYNAAPCGLATMTAEGVVTVVNDTLLAWLGVERAAVIGEPFGGLLETGSRLFYETRQVPVLMLQGSVEVSLTVRRPDGSTFPALVNARTQTDPEGRVVALQVALFDASARQEYERELLQARRAAEASEERVAALQEASSAFGASTSERGLSEALAMTALKAFAAAHAGVFLLDEDGRFRLYGGEYPLEAWIPAGSVGLGADALQSQEVEIVPNLAAARAASEPFAEAMEATHLSAMTVSPMLEDGMAVGVFVCWFAREREFDAEFVELQKALGRQAAQTLVRLRLQRQLEQLALFDQLTGLANRALIQEEVKKAISNLRRHSKPLALVFIDLDGFKAVNDRLGHHTGDAVLREVARRLRSEVRQHDTVGRFGGDEFVAICEDADGTTAQLIADRLRARVAEPIEGIPDFLPITASVGVAVVNPGGDIEATSDELLSMADNAMYRSKSIGKDRVTLVIR